MDTLRHNLGSLLLRCERKHLHFDLCPRAIRSKQRRSNTPSSSKITPTIYNRRNCWRLVLLPRILRILPSLPEYTPHIPPPIRTNDTSSRMATYSDIIHGMSMADYTKDILPIRVNFPSHGKLGGYQGTCFRCNR